MNNQKCNHKQRPREFEGWRATPNGVELCDCEYENLLEDFALIDSAPWLNPHLLHTIAARVGQLGYDHKIILRVLKAAVTLSPESFSVDFPEWCWENFSPYTASFIAFGEDFEKARAERTKLVKAHKRRGRLVKAHRRSLVRRERYV